MIGELLFVIAQLTLTESDVVLANHTGLPIARIEIDKRHFEGIGGGGERTGDIFVSVTPQKHYLRIVFRGGADAVWHQFDFKNVHEIIFERVKNKIEAHTE